MSDLGTDIRRYYEEIVERIDPSVSPVEASPRRRYTIRTGIGWAVLIGVIVLVVFGLGPLLFRSEPEPTAPPTTVSSPTIATTTPPVQLAGGPSVIITSDGVEMGSVSDSGISDAQETEALFDYVLQELRTNEDYWPGGGDPDELLGVYPDSPQTGLTVEVTIDTTIQRIVDSVISDWTTDSEAVIAVVVIDNRTGRIVAAGPASNRRSDLFDPERLLPAASLAQVYTTVAALEAGYSIQSEWDGSSPQTFTSPTWDGDWTVYNASGLGAGTVTLDAALYRSVNTVFANIGVEVGAEPIIDAATRLGVHLDGLDELPKPANQPAEGFAPLEAVATGAGEITTFDAATMFATISQNGVLTQPVIIESIADPDGQFIYKAPSQGAQTVDQQAVEDLSIPLAKVPTGEGTAPRANIGENQIGKTGTADNYAAAWYAGSTDRYTTAVSVVRLNPDNISELVPLRNVPIHGVMYPRVFGGSVPAPVWAQIMTQLSNLP